MYQLSIIVPAYNEAKTIRQILDKVNSSPIDKVIIVINNGSIDDTNRILRDIKFDNLKVIHFINNRGKGGAVLAGLSNATGEFAITQDADLEYDPNDYLKLLNAIKEKNVDLVLGARFLEGYHGLFIHKLGNRFLTRLLNFLFHCRLNDYATCYKLARLDTWHKLNLKATGFDIDVEIICNALKRKMQILEVPINYHPRTYKEGKKIRFTDALWATFYMFKYRFFRE